MALEIGKKKFFDDGIWCNYEGARLQIGRAQSVDFMNATEALERPHKRRIDKGTLPAEIKRGINIRAIARAVLLNWEGVENDGSPVPYTEDLGVLALTNDPDMLEFVIDTSIDNSNYKTEVEDKIAKKSLKSKRGSSNTATG